MAVCQVKLAGATAAAAVPGSGEVYRDRLEQGEGQHYLPVQDYQQAFPINRLVPVRAALGPKGVLGKVLAGASFSPLGCSS